MKQVLTVRLAPTPEQHAALTETMCAFNNACDWIARWASTHGTCSRWALHAGCYRQVRAQFSLSAQMATHAIKKAAVAQRRMATGKCATFRPFGGIIYDSRVMSFKGAEHVSLWTLQGRQLLAMRLGDYQRERIERRRGEANLVLRHGTFYLALTLDAPEPEPGETKGTIGVDLGIVNLATTSDGETYSGESVERCRTRYEKRRATLQAVNTRSARRRLAKNRHREGRFRRDQNHIISKRIVEKAQRTKCQIAVEDLTGIRTRIRARRPQRSRQTGWAFAQLREFLTYKAVLAGVPIVAVDPRNTSRECPECGHTEKANRRTRDEFVCRSCGHAAAADYVGALNIARRAEIMRPTVPERLHCTA